MFIGQPMRYFYSERLIKRDIHWSAGVWKTAPRWWRDSPKRVGSCDKGMTDLRKWFCILEDVDLHLVWLVACKKFGLRGSPEKTKYILCLVNITAGQNHNINETFETGELQICGNITKKSKLHALSNWGQIKFRGCLSTLLHVNTALSKNIRIKMHRISGLSVVLYGSEDSYL